MPANGVTGLYQVAQRLSLLYKGSALPSGPEIIVRVGNEGRFRLEGMCYLVTKYPCWKYDFSAIVALDHEPHLGDLRVARAEAFSIRAPGREESCSLFFPRGEEFLLAPKASDTHRDYRVDRAGRPGQP